MYKGNEEESLWCALGYLGPMFLVSYYINQKSLFVCANTVRSALIFINLIVVNIPVILYRNIIITSSIINKLFIIYMLFAFVYTCLLIFDYFLCIIQTANKEYKDTFIINKLFKKVINKYITKLLIKE